MFQVDAESQQLMKSIFISKAMTARSRSRGEKMLDGPRLFDDGCQIMKSGIRFQFPHFTEEQVQVELRRRLAIGRLIAEKGIYRDVGVLDE